MTDELNTELIFFGVGGVLVSQRQTHENLRRSLASMTLQNACRWSIKPCGHIATHMTRRNVGSRLLGLGFK